MAGVASRREGERMILAGKVKVNERVVKELGTKVDPEKDRITAGGKTVSPEEKVYLMLNKPAGYLCSLKDRFGRPLVTDLIEGVPERLYPVGRLDLDSEGLLLLSNDGELTLKLTHPACEVEKVYRIRLRSKLEKEQGERLRQGVILGGGKRTAPAGVKICDSGQLSVEITIHEGKKRQVKRMLEAVGNKVLHLERIAIGPLKLGELPRGEWRHLKPSELSALKAAAKKP